MTELRIVPLCDASPPLRALLALTARAEGSLSWFQVVAEAALPPGERAWAVQLLENGTPTAVLPLATGAHGARALTAPYTTRYVPAFVSNERAWELGRRARSYAGGVLRMDACDMELPGMAAFVDGLRASGLALAQFEHFANWHQSIDDFDQWWTTRSSRLKNTVRRKHTAAGKIGLAFDFLRMDFEPAISAYGEIYQSSWKEPEPYPDFIPTLIRTLGREAMMRMGIMRVGGRAIAAQIWLVCGNQATVFKLAHREDAAEYSPGTLLMHWMTERLVREEGVRDFDFGRGDDAYKRDWFSSRSWRSGFIAADWRTKSGLKTTLREVIPTLGTRAFRKQFGGNHAGSAAAEH